MKYITEKIMVIKEYTLKIALIKWGERPNVWENNCTICFTVLFNAFVQNIQFSFNTLYFIHQGLYIYIFFSGSMTFFWYDIRVTFATYPKVLRSIFRLCIWIGIYKYIKNWSFVMIQKMPPYIDKKYPPCYPFMNKKCSSLSKKHFVMHIIGIKQ